MDLDKEFDLLKIYIQEYIDKLKPVLLDYQIKQYSNTGFIEYGHNGKFISFDVWKKSL